MKRNQDSPVQNQNHLQVSVSFTKMAEKYQLRTNINMIRFLLKQVKLEQIAQTSTGTA